MRSAIRLVSVLLVLGSTAFAAESPGSNRSPSRLDEQRRWLASLEEGMDSAKVLKLLGEPDEIRRIPEGVLVDGAGQAVGGKYPGQPGAPREAERWAYGVLAPRMFAAIGYVSVDAKGKVVGATPADRLCRPVLTSLRRVPAPTEQAVPTGTNLSCNLGPVEYSAADGSLKTTVTLKNAGAAEFRLKHHAAFAIQPFLIVEVRDSQERVLWRVYEMVFHPPVRINDDHPPSYPSRETWPTLSIPAGKSKSEVTFFNPSSGFGRLPAGRYFLRVFFPFENENFYPSNLVPFDVFEDQKPKPKG